jgi:hypothetical protein
MDTRPLELLALRGHEPAAPRPRSLGRLILIGAAVAMAEFLFFAALLMTGGVLEI